MDAEKRIEELGFKLPSPPQPIASYIPAVTTGNLIFTSGILPIENGQIKTKGKIGYEELSIEDGYVAARISTLNALSIIKDKIGDLDRIEKIVKLTGYINSSLGFTDQPKVLNGASELLVSIFADRGKHARVAVGVSDLPMNSPVEIELIVEVKQ